LTADIVYVLSPALRAAVTDNMRHVLESDADNAALKQAVRGVLRNAARNYFDLIKIPHMKLSDIESCMTVHGWHNLEDALKRGKGVILVTAHLGSFDMGAQILIARSIGTTVLVEPLEPAALLGHVTALRESKGLTFVPVQLGMLRIVIQLLRRGEVVLIACDRDIGRDGLKAIFFGEETTLPAGAVRIAMRTGAAVVPAFNLRRDDDGYDVYFEPAVEIIAGGNQAVARNMEQITSVMEKYIKTCPEQWVVLSPIWASEQ
jgi:KDO2-lipid IV(A) lauroyltransferase